MTDFNAGDIVRLKSGGPPMTVRRVTTARLSDKPDAPRDHAECQWFEGERISDIVRFPFAALEPGGTSEAAAA